MNILLADDHSIVRRGLKEILLEEFPDANFQEASDGQELIRKMRADKFDVIISDVSMPGKKRIGGSKSDQGRGSIDSCTCSQHSS